MRIRHLITTVDSHTEGMGTRVITAGVPAIPGASVAAKKVYVQQHLDWIRTSLLHEPRGHADSFGALLVPPSDPRAALGVIWMGPASYPDMCGHGSIGVATVAIETGMVAAEEPTTVLALDTPAGLVTTRAQVEDGRVQSVSVRNVPSFAVQVQAPLPVPGVGTLRIDLAYGGNFGVMVDARSAGVDLSRASVPDLLALGSRIRQAARARFPVLHPVHPHIADILMVGFTDRASNGGADYLNVFMNDIHIDRSPCGTGSSARGAALHARGMLALGQPVVLESLLGTRYTLTLVETAAVGRYRAVVPEIAGRAFVTGFQQFALDPEDPFRHGFLLGMRAPAVAPAGNPPLLPA